MIYLSHKGRESAKFLTLSSALRTYGTKAAAAGGDDDRDHDGDDDNDEHNNSQRLGYACLVCTYSSAKITSMQGE
jgi:hypothetical protein